MTRLLPWLTGIAALAVWLGVVQLKSAVKEREAEVAALRAELASIASEQRVLQSEWAYLTSPARLQSQSLEFFALMPPRPDQFSTDLAAIPYRLSGPKPQKRGVEE